MIGSTQTSEKWIEVEFSEPNVIPVEIQFILSPNISNVKKLSQKYGYLVFLDRFQCHNERKTVFEVI